MEGPTLHELKYGPGFRPGPVLQTTAPWHGCGVDDCGDQVYGSTELFVDDPVQPLDWYTRVLSRLPQRVWTRVAFCIGHLEAVLARSEDYLSDPALWAPGRMNPPVLPRGMTLH